MRIYLWGGLPVEGAAGVSRGRQKRYCASRLLVLSYLDRDFAPLGTRSSLCAANDVLCSLATGYWLLATGHWLLATDY
jgi:hypothetical protein